MPGTWNRGRWRRKPSWPGAAPGSAPPPARSTAAGGLNTFFHLPGLGSAGETPSAASGTVPGPGAGAARGTICACWPRPRGRATSFSTTLETLGLHGDPGVELKFVTVQALHAGGPGWKERKGRLSSSPQAVPGAGQVLPAAGMPRGRCSSPGRGGPWTGPTSGSYTISVKRRGWRPSGSSPTTSAPLRPGLLCLGKGYFSAKLADLLGHASVETTRIYIMESGAEHRRQVERLGLVV